MVGHKTTMYIAHCSLCILLTLGRNSPEQVLSRAIRRSGLSADLPESVVVCYCLYNVKNVAHCHDKTRSKKETSLGNLRQRRSETGEQIHSLITCTMTFRLRSKKGLEKE